jgi:cysteine-rich repeat protein
VKSLLAAIVIFVAACANKPSAHECTSGIVCPDPLQCAAVQPVCISNSCGNGVVDPGEVCDDGNIVNGDGCSADCKSKESCGDGVLNTDAGEVCDDGNTIDGDGCSADCKSLETCGNGIVDTAKGEVCDDGNTHAGKCGDGHGCDTTADCTDGTLCTPDGCSGDCKSNETCGNGIKDLGEVCDDGGAAGGCEDDCQHGVGCGNGVLDPGEQCDDGNLTDTDDCTSGCKINVCGDGVIDLTGITHHETCDRGANGVAVETSDCNIDCTTPTCGDGKVNLHFKPDGTHVEQCDLGSISGVNQNQDDRDCTAHCLLNVCGDGHQDTAGTHTEACDDGNQIENDGCTTSCTLPAGGCGNGIVDMGEECDLGSTAGVSNNTLTSSCPSCKIEKCGDGNIGPGEDCDPGMAGETATCNKNCKTPTCGDGYVNIHFTPPGAAGVEKCDNGALNSDTGACTTKCQIARCGDGLTETGVEQCDTTVASATCDADCTNPVCGDMVINPNFKPDGTLAEQCDDGVNNGKPNDPCDYKCRTAGCGNGIIETGETCDTSGESATCDSDCTAPFCGDGTTNGHFKPDGVNVENCDNGFGNTDADCPYEAATCAQECSTSCRLFTPRTPDCGDGIIDNGHETCDDSGATNSITECAYPSTDPCEACKACLIVLFPPQSCGDGVKQAAHEDCEPPNTATCGPDCHTPTCTDTFKDGLETDLDCGGALCDGNGHKCGNGLHCIIAPDCVSGVCTATFCSAPTCADGVKNGTETGIDCGNAACFKCAGDTCTANGDCHSNSCGMTTAGLCD